jgi:thiamine biosynthesis protein ThiI
MWQIVLKRLMLRAAEAVARDRNAAAIVTGDAVGQVSSQTLINLAAIGEATSLPILRPLVGSNKEDIIATARAIGTFELSAKVDEYCALVQGKPATAATVAQARAQEERLFHAEPDLLERVIAERTTIDLRRIDLASFDDEELRTEEIRAGDSVIDLRSKPAYAAWHFPDALYLDFAHALRAYPHFDASRRYVLYCEFGLKSAHLAEVMRRQGLDASHFAGGLKELMRYARERGVATPEI